MGMIFRGEITGSESLLIDGCTEGSIKLPGYQVTIGQHASVTSTIAASYVTVAGVASGMIHASDRLEVRAEGSVTGNACAPRLSIQLGAFLSGAINTLKAESRPVSNSDAAAHSPEAAKMRLVDSRKPGRLRTNPVPRPV
jgi:cytoskeletal protein CcmA (bactofilin family)